MSTSASAAIGRLRNRNSTAQVLLINEYTSTARIRIELPVPTKKLWNFYFSVKELLIGDRRSTWEKFLTGEKVSDFSKQASYVLTALTYIYLIYVASSSPSSFGKAFTQTTAFLTFLRVLYLRATRQMFEIMDFQYAVALLTIVAVGSTSSPLVWKLAVGLQLGSFLVSWLAAVDYPSITFSNPNSLMRLQKVLLTFGSSLALYLKYATSTPYVQKKLSSADADPVTVFQEHFVVPASVFFAWGVFYLFVTEVVYSRVLYRRGKTTRQEKTSMKTLFAYNKRNAKDNVNRKYLVSRLKHWKLLKPDDEFVPEKLTNHHGLVVASYMLTHSLFVAIGLFFGFLFAKFPQLFPLYLENMVLWLLIYGAKETLSLKGPAKTTRQPSVLQSVYSSGSSALDEGGDEPGESWEKSGSFQPSLTLPPKTPLVSDTEKVSAVSEKIKDQKEPEEVVEDTTTAPADTPDKPEVLSTIAVKDI